MSRVGKNCSHERFLSTLKMLSNPISSLLITHIPSCTRFPHLSHGLQRCGQISLTTRPISLLTTRLRDRKSFFKLKERLTAGWRLWAQAARLQVGWLWRRFFAARGDREALTTAYALLIVEYRMTLTPCNASRRGAAGLGRAGLNFG